MAVLGFFNFSCFSQENEKENDRESLNLKGNVKSIEECTFKAIEYFGEVEIDYSDFDNFCSGKLKRIIFNSFGNIIEENHYGRTQMNREISNKNEIIERKFYNGSMQNFVLRSKTKNKYNDRGICIEVSKFNQNGSTNFKNKYDDEGNTTEEIYYDQKGAMYRKTKSTYDERGKLIEEIRYDENGAISSKTKSIYDDKGNTTEEIYYDQKGAISSKTTSAYDEKGKLIEEINYDEKGAISSKTKFIYDQRGNHIEDIYYNKEEAKNVKTKYIYDDRNNCVEVIEVGSGDCIRITKSKYDDNGNVVEAQTIDENNKLLDKMINKFDKNGNCIEEYEYVSNGGVSYSCSGMVLYRSEFCEGYKLETEDYTENQYQQITYDENDNWIKKK
ncbi:MAG: hypothetical protein IPH57_08460 [Saprospiraceae bacterium]|nr:hypothetical protein [Saprospiraceae bacterium]